MTTQNPNIKKEITAFILTVIAIILLCMLFVNTFAQSDVRQDSMWYKYYGDSVKLISPPVKIGVLQINGDEADEYLKDCLTHADTVEMHYHGKEGKYLKHYSLTQSRPIIADYYVATMTYDDKQYNDDLKRKSIHQYEEHGLTYYIIPRQPSEIDYIKWKSNKK